MAMIKAHEADRALARPDPSWRLFLFYGPDAGLISERAAALARSSVDDPQDAFQLIRMDGDAVASDPLKLVDEANTIGLFGGRRAIRVSPTSRPLVAAIEPLLATPSQDAIVVIEAGDLQKSNPLRTACERAKSALAVPCYGDAARDLGTIVDEMVRASGKSIDRSTRDLLTSLLGGDRQTSRKEIDKLIVYAGNDPALTADHVEAVVGDTAQREQAGVVDAVFAGRLPSLDLALAKLAGEGLDQGVLLGAVLRHALALLKAKLAIEGGKPAREAVGAMRMPYPRLATAEAALNAWPAARLRDAVTILGAAILAVRRDSDMARPIAARALWTLSRMSGKGR
ncbi:MULTISPECIES: DNA polymerase III subunit delta [unclassified Bosea (in: a-proteobacteria)]|uniref:DNA polymerase III subunit delta n=1 Tax=unclassified Bosea (in: a-proteobacteria) TaxID=2653178 RepID=UPI000F75F489|nr:MULTISPECIES: DNA polymerase III subunit delta [unclassified Bosea (in: a-proteobacteria)]AZO79868.1 DNA polymerase III subunit delta [Bosea sp. Tri-49]RXT15870.1 DNA polymerase III subunit delta [Bosea sp. Tri-39]RXT39563.1 DNA polymerase III subunit delta [Bosea sp. Tri-54]